MTEGTDMSQIEKVARAFPALWNLVQYHKSGGHSGSGSDRTLANALRELAAIAAMPVQSEPVAELRAEITRLTEALRAAEEREKGLREDAGRYHWLRDHSCPPHNFYISVPDEFAGQRYAPGEEDAYIDAARAALKGPSHDA